jgi:hypothetical protein
MNTVGWGGARVGSGQKGKEQTVVPDAVDMPADLPEGQRGFWECYAELAMEQGTLTKHTIGAFLLLCEMDEEKRQVKATIDRDGRTFIKVTVDGAGVEHQELKAHPLTGAYGRLAKAVEALLARFRLAPFGKPEKTEKAKPKANPWARVAK